MAIKSDMLHPDRVLTTMGDRKPVLLSGCEHIAGTEKFLKKALTIQKELNGIFDITCDLEDGIASSDVAKALTEICSALCSPDNQHGRMGVRLVPFSHPEWTSSTTTLLKEAGDKIAYLTLPKISHYFELVYISSCIKTITTLAGFKKRIPLHVLIENRSALIDLHQIASHADVEALDFGIMDFVADHNGAIGLDQIHSPAQFNHRLLVAAKIRLVEAALNANIVPCHNVTVNYADPEAAYQDALTARTQFGFLRMWSIHPAQIEPIIRAMQPNIHEVEQASEILLAAYAKNWAPVGYEGVLYDRASYRSLWQLLKRAKATGVALPDDCEAKFF